MFGNKKAVAALKEEYHKQALSIIQEKIANIKHDTDFDNILPILDFAQKMGLITLDESINLYTLAKNGLAHAVSEWKKASAEMIAKHKAH